MSTLALGFLLIQAVKFRYEDDSVNVNMTSSIVGLIQRPREAHWGRILEAFLYSCVSLAQHPHPVILRRNIQ